MERSVRQIPKTALKSEKRRGANIISKYALAQKRMPVGLPKSMANLAKSKTSWMSIVDSFRHTFGRRVRPRLFPPKLKDVAAGQ